MNRNVLAPLAAAAALAMAGISTAQAQEATAWEMPPPSASLTRAEVVADLQAWRQAGVHDTGNEAGISDTVLQRRVAMNRMAEERHARALEQLEQQRLAAEAAARAQPAQVMAEGPPATGTAAPALSTEPPAAETAQVSPVPDSAPPTPTDNPAPPVASPDALTDTNRERDQRIAEPMPMATGRDDAAPQDAPDVPMESEPVDAAADAAPKPATSEVPATESTPSQPPVTDATPVPQATPNSYGYQEPSNKYPSDSQPPAETDTAPTEAQPKPVR
jgi:hypothetical protein